MTSLIWTNPNVRSTYLTCSRRMGESNADPLGSTYIQRGRNAAPETSLSELDCPHQDFRNGISKSRNPIRPTWTAVMNMTIHEPRNQRTRPTLNDSDSGPVALPLGCGSDPVDPSVANLHRHFWLRRRTNAIPKLNLVNQEMQFFQVVLLFPTLAIFSV